MKRKLGRRCFLSKFAAGTADLLILRDSQSVRGVPANEKINVALVGIDLARGKEKDQMGEGRHLFCPTGFLDEHWFHRSYWIFGKNAGEGHGEYPVPRNYAPTGRIMVFDDSRVYAFFAHNVGNNINPRTSYSLYAAEKDGFLVEETATEKSGRSGKKKKRGKPTKSASRISMKNGTILCMGPDR